MASAYGKAFLFLIDLERSSLHSSVMMKMLVLVLKTS